MGTMMDAVVQSIVQPKNGIFLFEAKDFDGKPTAKCPACARRQFVKHNQDRCVACGSSLLVDGPESDENLNNRTQTAADLQGFGLRICIRMKEVRVAKGIPQAALARAVPCPRTYISKYENGNCTPTVELVCRLARALGVQPVDLLNEAISVRDLARRTITYGGTDEDVIVALVCAMPRLSGNARMILCEAARGLTRGQFPFSKWIEV